MIALLKRPLNEAERDITVRALRLMYARLVAVSKWDETELPEEAHIIHTAIQAIGDDE